MRLYLTMPAVLALALLVGSVAHAPTAPAAATAAVSAAVPGGLVPAAAFRPAAVLPIADYAERRTYKAYGTYVDDGRFLGWHVGDDIEYADAAAEVPVRAIADGEVLYAGKATGYGGLIVIAHTVEGEEVSAIYGHLDIASTRLRAGSRVMQGQFLATLGDHESEETDGRRKHLHFGLYPGHELRTAGYVNRSEMPEWIDPQVFFLRHGLVLPDPRPSYAIASESTR